MSADTPTSVGPSEGAAEGVCACHDRWAGSLPLCVLRRWHSRAARASDPGFLFLLDETFVGSLQASFTEAAGNNIVPAFGCVRSHISGCSIRNRPQCRTINPWPQQQICAVTAQHGTINQTRREKCTHPPMVVGCCFHPMNPAYVMVDVFSCYRIITKGDIIGWL